MVFPSASVRSAPRLVEPSTTRRSSAAADPILAGVVPTIAPREHATGAPTQRHLPANGSLRFRLANIIVAVLRSTALRRVVDGLPDHHH